jgi:hypothetical protein
MAFGVGLGIALLGACSADAAVLCVKKTGVVVVRDACKHHEQAMDLSQFGASGPPGAVGAQGPSGPGVFVLDANGALVGPVVDEMNVFGVPVAPRVIRKLGNDVVSVPVDTVAGFPEHPSPPPVFFVGPGCTGAMFLVPPAIPLMSFTIAFTTAIHNQVAYYALGAGATQAYASYVVFPVPPSACTGGGGTPVGSDGCCVASASSATLSPGRSFDLTTLQLVTPFHAVAP